MFLYCRFGSLNLVVLLKVVPLEVVLLNVVPLEVVLLKVVLLEVVLLKVVPLEVVLLNVQSFYEPEEHLDLWLLSWSSRHHQSSASSQGNLESVAIAILCFYIVGLFH